MKRFQPVFNLGICTGLLSLFVGVKARLCVIGMVVAAAVVCSAQVTFPVGVQPNGVAFDGANMWVTNYDSNNVTKLRARDGALLGTFGVGIQPYGIAFDGASMWVANYGSNTVSKLRASDGIVLGTFGVGIGPHGVVFDGVNIWVSNWHTDNVSKLQASDGTVLGTYGVGSCQREGCYPSGMAFDGANIWVANFETFGASKLRASDGMLLGQFAYPGARYPVDIAFDGTNMWVSNQGFGTVAKLASDGTIAGSNGLNASASTGIVFDGANVWVADYFRNYVSELRASDGVVLRTCDVGSNPSGMAFDGANIWVANNGSNTVTKVGARCDVTDSTPPLIVPTVTGTAGANGWYASGVTVSWSVTDPESAIASSTGCGPTTLTANTSGTTLTCSATNGGGLTSSVPVTIKIDQTPPVIVPTVSGPLGANGWYTGIVTVSWSFTDPESGIASSSGCDSTTLTAGTTLTCSATNRAGLLASLPVTVKIDKTFPVISGMPAAGCTLWPPNHKMVTVATVSASDAGSGLAPGSFTVTGTSNEPSDPKDPDIVITANGSGGFAVQLREERLGTGSGRIYSLTSKATDLAGNPVTATATCTVPHDQGH